MNFVLNGIAGIVSGFTPRLVKELNGISQILGPNLIAALGGIVQLLGQPEIAAKVAAAAEDPAVLVSALGAAALLIPGLAETIDPVAFAKDPNLRYKALIGLVAVSLAKLNGVDINALALQFGLPPLPPDFVTPG